MNTREIKKLEVNDKEYAYLELKTGDGVIYYNTTFIQVPITDKYREMFEGIGGFTRDVLYNSIKELDVNQLTIISKTTEQYTMVTSFIFEKDKKEVHLVTTVEDLFLGHVIDLLNKNEDIVGKINIQNSLNYMGDTVYGGYLEDYKKPLTEYQSGLFYKGKPILFGETFLLKGLKDTQHIFKGSMLQAIREGGVESLHVQVLDKVGGYNIVTKETMLKGDGSVYTYLDYDKLQGTEPLTTQEVVDKNLEEHKKIFKSKNEEQSYQEVMEELNSPYVELFPMEVMNYILEQEGITIEKV